MRECSTRLLPAAALAALLLSAASCEAPHSGTIPAAPPGTATPAPASGSALESSLAGRSLMGTAISGDEYCSYYAPNGSLTRAFAGTAPEYGTWSVDGMDLCERIGPTTGCSRLIFQPNGLVSITSLEGSGLFATMATIADGNRCGV